MSPTELKRCAQRKHIRAYEYDASNRIDALRLEKYIRTDEYDDNNGTGELHPGEDTRAY